MKHILETIQPIPKVTNFVYPNKLISCMNHHKLNRENLILQSNQDPHRNFPKIRPNNYQNPIFATKPIKNSKIKRLGSYSYPSRRPPLLLLDWAERERDPLLEEHRFR